MSGHTNTSIVCRYYPSDEFHLGVPYVLLKRDLGQPEGVFSDNKMAFEGNNNEEMNIHVKPHHT